jgi:hypothetical protein
MLIRNDRIILTAVNSLNLLVNDMLTPFIFLVTPRKVYGILKLKPQWIAPFIAAVIGLVMKTWLNNSWGIQSFISQAHSVYLIVLCIAFLVVGLWSVIAASLYLSILLIEAYNGTSFKSLFSIVSYCGIIFMLDEITNFFLIRAKIIDSMLFALPHRFPIGLDILALGSNPHPALAILLHSINPFTIWYFTYLSIGLSIVADLSKTKARMLTLLIWVIAVGFALSILLITGETALRIRFRN